MIQANSSIAKVISILFSFFLLGLLEAGARLAAPPPDRLDDILEILRPDPSLIWKVREGLDVPFSGQTGPDQFAGIALDAGDGPKDPRSFRIVCLGESLTFGWGVDGAETYPRVLEGLLRGKVPGYDRVEVINAGQVGFSSLQGVRFFERVVAPLAPGVITVPYVINDVDRFRFFGATGGVMPISRRIIPSSPAPNIY